MIQVYTGNGKGKTTAALGLALRAAGAGLHVYIGQFVKCGHTCELNSLRKIGNVKVEQFGRPGFVKGAPTEKDRQAACAGFDKIKKVLFDRRYDVVILDEINVAVRLGLIDARRLTRLMKQAPVGIELVLTGRNAAREILEAADLVSQVRQLKHYFDRGHKARKGIEF